MTIVLEDTDIIKHGMIAAKLGFAIFPLKPLSKKPWGGYKHIQGPPTEDQIRSWWEHHPERGMAVRLGDTSGGLICRDWDTPDAYVGWRESHPALAAAMPTSQTKRGFHSYCRAKAEVIAQVDQGKCFLPGSDGELKFRDSYVVLPPTRHEDNDVNYRWIRPPWNGTPEVGDLAAAGLVPHLPKRIQRPRQQRPSFTVEGTQAMVGVSIGQGEPIREGKPIEDLDSQTKSKVNDAIRATQPTGFGQRNRCVFQLARRFKSLFQRQDPRALKQLVFEWYKSAYPRIRTHDFSETWIDFIVGWYRVRFPFGGDIQALFDQSQGIGLDRLIDFCRLLAAETPGQPFYLPCRKAGELLGIPHRRANQWLNHLRETEVLILAHEHSFCSRGGSRAREWFFQG